MALAASNLGTGGSETDAASFTCSVSDPGTNCWLVIDVFSRNASVTPNLPTLSGGSLTYSAETDVTDATVRRLSRWFAKVTTSPGAFTLTADFAVQTQTICLIHVNKVSNASTSDPIVASVTAVGSSIGPTATLSAFASGNNRPMAAFVNFAGAGPMTPDGTATELAETPVAPTEGISMETMYDAATADTTPSVTHGSVDPWVAIASELADGGVASADLVDPMGMTGFFGG